MTPELDADGNPYPKARHGWPYRTSEGDHPQPTGDGGLAFPHVFVEDVPDEDKLGGTVRVRHQHLGMSLRDWFAGQALTGMLTNPMYDDNHSANVAQQAYMQADAMLLARDLEE